MTDPSRPTDPRSKTWRPKGIWGAVMLPINPNGEIDFGALAEEVDIMCASSVAGIYTNGTAAEFFNQTEAEFDQITELVAARAQKSGKPFQIGVSNSNPRIARDRLLRAQSFAPTGVQVTLPDWWPPSSIENTRFMAGMQEAAGEVPLILYNPPHAKRQLSLSEVAALRAVAPNMVGIKVKGGDDAWYAERRALLPDFSVFVAGHTVAHGRPRGADGAYSNVACLSPDGAVRYWDMIETDRDAAEDLEARFLAFLKTHLVPLAQAKGLSDAALDKLMAAAGGWGPVTSRLLWPYSGADASDVQAIAEAARNELPELFT
ncbi:MAG: dihydrodipicolinate synthase family protein [Hyphomicrobiaceae bacterium]|nr:dihydrodipicolinate synthase family protein [Hyphomicrobiaceae bacterium]